VLCTDPHVTVDQTLAPLDEVLRESDLLIIATPHKAYAELDVDIPVVDIWNLLGKGVRV
jgi:UDP-N-acetyl-D-mannosaminuronic acid dehydrogenase